MTPFEAEAHLLGVAEKIEAGFPDAWPKLVATVRFTWKSWARGRLGQVRAKRRRGVIEPLGIELSLHRILIDRIDDRRETFLHEVAHAIVELGGGRDIGGHHGVTWSAVAQKLGIEPVARSSDQVLGRLLTEHRERKLKVVAICFTCDIEIRRARALPRGRTYLCGGCKTPLARAVTTR